MSEALPITRAKIDEVLEFLPIFEDPDFKFDEWQVTNAGLEKFRHGLEGLHGVIEEIGRHHTTEVTTANAVQNDLVGFQVKYAFQSAIVGYLALKNMPALASDNDLGSRLLSYSREEFKDWLDRIDQGGSVKG